MFCPKCSKINYPFEMKRHHCVHCGYDFPSELISDFKPKGQSNEKQEEPMLKWFEYKHLPQDLQIVSRDFSECAHCLCHAVGPGPERTVALRKLLEAKDAAVRAKLYLSE